MSDRGYKDCDHSGPRQQIGDYLYCAKCGRPKSKILRSNSPEEEIKAYVMKFKTAEDIIYLRLSGEVCFNCPCREEIILNEDDSIKECECGRVYHFTQYVEVEDK